MLNYSKISKSQKTWYITSDAIIEFLHYNNLEEVFEQKYKDLEQIRQEYPYIVRFQELPIPAWNIKRIISCTWWPWKCSFDRSKLKSIRR